jgi:hypothetical protein
LVTIFVTETQTFIGTLNAGKYYWSVLGQKGNTQGPKTEFSFEVKGTPIEPVIDCSNFPSTEVVLFEKRLCAGGYLKPGLGFSQLAPKGFDNKTYSILIPQGFSVRVYEGAATNSLTDCYTQNMWDLGDMETYWESEVPVGGTISSVMIFLNDSCQLGIVDPYPVDLFMPSAAK